MNKIRPSENSINLTYFDSDNYLNRIVKTSNNLVFFFILFLILQTTAAIVAILAFSQYIVINQAVAFFLFCVLSVALILGILTFYQLWQFLRHLQQALQQVLEEKKVDSSHSIPQFPETLAKLTVAFHRIATYLHQIATDFHLLQKREKEIIGFLESMPIGVGILDAEGKPYYTNTKARQLLGQEIESNVTVERLAEVYQLYVAGTNQLYPKENGPTLSALRGHIATVDNVEIRRPDRVIPLEIWSAPIFDKNGKVIYAIDVFQDITKRKQSEARLCHDKEKLITALETKFHDMAVNVPGVIYQWYERQNGERGFYYVSPRCEDYLCGLKAEELIRNWQLLPIHAEDIPIWEQTIREAVVHQKEWVCEGRFILPTGEVRWWQGAARPFLVSEDEIVFNGIIIDITERKLAEEALRNSEERFKAIFNNAAVGIKLIDSDGNYVHLNNKLVAMLGYTREELSSLTIATITYPQDHAVSYEKIRQLINGELDTYQLEKRYVRKEGSIFWGTLWAAALRDVEGKLHSIVGIVVDITERKQAEEKLQSNLHFLSTLINTLPIPAFYKDAKGRYLGCNLAFSQFVGKVPEDLISKRAEELWSVEVATAYLHADLQLMDQGGKHTYEILIPHLDGSYRKVIFNKAAFYQADGHIGGIVGTLTDITDLKRTEEALRASEERFELAMCGANDGLWDWNLAYHTVYYSPRWKQMLGYTEDEIGNHPDEWYARIHPQQIAEVKAQAQAYLNREIPVYEVTYQMQHKQGHYLWILTRGIAVWKNGKPYRMVGTSMDLTNQKQVEGQLRQQKEFLNLVINNVPQRIFWKDLHSVYLGCNHHFAQTAGLETPEQIVGKTDFDLPWKPLEAEKYRQDDHRVMSSGIPEYHLVETVTQVNDQKIWVETNKTPLYDAMGNVIGILGTYEDITERYQAESELQKNKMALEKANAELSQFKSTLDVTLDGVLMFDAESLHFFYANQGAENYLGYTQEELLQMTLLDLDSEVIVSGIYELVLSYTTRPAQTYETVHRRKDGLLIPVEIFLQYIELPEQHNRFVAIVRDITERKQAEFRLQQAKEAAEIANHAKSAFLANMSHELRTPLNGILGYTQILSRDSNLTEKQRNGIEIIHRSGEHLLRLINDILDLSKIEAGKLELVANEFRFPEFLKDIADLLRMRAEQKGIQFFYEPLSSLPAVVYADEKRLRQILLNLLSNAVKFTNQGQVNLKVVYYNTRARFEVEDTGTGIAFEQLDDIFLPFQQISKQNQYIEGTGLGLSISKKLVELMDGQLQVESLLGKGSLFWFEIALPEIQTQNHIVETQLPHVIAYRGARHKILVVDDVYENRVVLTVLLETLGFIVTEAENGRQALALIKNQNPEVVITDLLMPEMDGIELTRHIRQSADLKDIIVIINSASVFEQHRRESLEAGCNAFVAKPINTEILLELLQRHLQLEWVYEKIATPLPAQEASVPKEIVGPPPEQAAELLKLVMMGDIRMLVERVTELEEGDATLSPFAEKVRQLAKGFKMSKIEKFIKPYTQMN